MTVTQTSSSSSWAFHPCVVCDDESPVQPKAAGLVRLLHHDVDEHEHEDQEAQHIEDTFSRALDNELWAEWPECPEPKSTLSKVKRQYRKKVETANLRDFLSKHGFSMDIHEPRIEKGGCSFFWTQTEELYPIHVAAQLGDLKILRVLLRYGADPKEKSSRGRVALEMARKADIAGSHSDVIHLLKDVHFVKVRDVLTMGSESSS